MENLFVIIPVHNRKGITKNCLLLLTDQSDKNYNIIVVDDGSTDGTSEMITDEFPDIILLQGDGNLWWSGAINKGVKFALKLNADYVLCLNDDITVKDDFIEKIKYWADKYQNSIFGCAAADIHSNELLYLGTKFIWKYGNSIDYKKDELKRNYKENMLIELDNYVGRGLLIPAEVFKRIGLFDDEGFPQSGADQDFTFKAHKAGYKIYVNTEAKIYSTFSEKDNIFFKEFNLKNFYKYLTSRKSSANIYYQVKLGWRHAPLKYKLIYCIIITIRCAGGYIRRWIINKKKQ